MGKASNSGSMYYHLPSPSSNTIYDLNNTNNKIYDKNNIYENNNAYNEINKPTTPLKHVSMKQQPLSFPTQLTQPFNPFLETSNVMAMGIDPTFTKHNGNLSA